MYQDAKALAGYTGTSLVCSVPSAMIGSPLHLDLKPNLPLDQTKPGALLHGYFRSWRLLIFLKSVFALWMLLISLSTCNDVIYQDLMTGTSTAIYPKIEDISSFSNGHNSTVGGGR